MERGSFQALCVGFPCIFESGYETNDNCSKTYEPGEEEEVREGFNPDEPEPQNPEAEHNLNHAFTENQSKEEQRKHDIKPHIVSEANHWETRNVSDQKTSQEAEDHPSPSYGSFREERNAWNAD